MAYECVGHTDAVGAVAFHSRRATGAAGGFLVTGSADRTVKIWTVPSADHQPDGTGPLRCKSEFTQLAHQKDINAVAVSPNDRMFATASQDRTLKLWNAADCTVIGTCKGHKRGVWSAAFSPVDKVVVSASGDASLKLWSVDDCSCLRTFEGHDASVLKVRAPLPPRPPHHPARADVTRTLQIADIQYFPIFAPRLQLRAVDYAKRTTIPRSPLPPPAATRRRLRV